MGGIRKVRNKYMSYTEALTAVKEGTEWPTKESFMNDPKMRDAFIAKLSEKTPEEIDDGLSVLTGLLRTEIEKTKNVHSSDALGDFTLPVRVFATVAIGTGVAAMLADVIMKMTTGSSATEIAGGVIDVGKGMIAPSGVMLSLAAVAGAMGGLCHLIRSGEIRASERAVQELESLIPSRT
jgi:hypothetical protein